MVMKEPPVLLVMLRGQFMCFIRIALLKRCDEVSEIRLNNDHGLSWVVGVSVWRLGIY